MTKTWEDRPTLCMVRMAVAIYGILVVSKLLTEVLGHNFMGAIILWVMA